LAGGVGIAEGDVVAGLELGEAAPCDVPHPAKSIEGMSTAAINSDLAIPVFMSATSRVLGSTSSVGVLNVCAGAAAKYVWRHTGGMA
jgi:hypothetical protein